jgi:hypothetical protein
MSQRVEPVATVSSSTKIAKTKKALKLGVSAGKIMLMAVITVMLGNQTPKKKKDKSI